MLCSNGMKSDHPKALLTRVSSLRSHCLPTSHTKYYSYLFFATYCSKYRTVIYYLEKQTTTQLLSFLNSLERTYFRFGT